MPDQPALNEYLDAIEASLRLALAAPSPEVEPLYRMMQYHMGWLDETFVPAQASRGKRLRPLICVLACQAAGGDWHCALPAAAAIELVHNFTLIHDDIEDDSASRRHRTTLWKLWGIAQGVNTGDAMWAIARRTLARSVPALPPNTLLSIITELDEACLKLCHGQYLDISFESSSHVTMHDYETMIAGKTAALLASAAACGALAAHAEEDLVEYYRGFGHQLGLAFQMQDDFLGIWGDSRITGKPVADDIISRKKTFPVLHALEWEARHGYDDLAGMYDSHLPDERRVPAVLQLLERAGARAATRARVEDSLEATLRQIELTHGEPIATTLLVDLAAELVQRDS